MYVTVSSKGQIVLPADIRRKYGIKQGQKLQLVDFDGRIWLVPSSEDAIARADGAFKIEDGGPPATEWLVQERRRERGREEEKLRRWMKE